MTRRSTAPRSTDASRSEILVASARSAGPQLRPGTRQASVGSESSQGSARSPAARLDDSGPRADIEYGAPTVPLRRGSDLAEDGLDSGEALHEVVNGGAATTDASARPAIPGGACSAGGETEHQASRRVARRTGRTGTDEVPLSVCSSPRHDGTGAARRSRRTSREGSARRFQARAVKPLAGEVVSYDAPSTDEIARRTGSTPRTSSASTGTRRPAPALDARRGTPRGALARPHVSARRLPAPPGRDRPLRGRRAGERRARCRRRRPDPARDAHLCRSRRPRGNRQRPHLSHVLDRRVGRWRGDRRREPRADDLLPAEQSDRRARPAPGRAPARRRRGVFRIRGRDRRRPDRRGRDRAQDLLEGLRPRRCPRRLRARGPRRRRGAEPAPASGSALDPVGRTGACRARDPAGRPPDPRRARALRVAAP